MDLRRLIFSKISNMYIFFKNHVFFIFRQIKVLIKQFSLQHFIIQKALSHRLSYFLFKNKTMQNVLSRYPGIRDEKLITFQRGHYAPKLASGILSLISELSNKPGLLLLRSHLCKTHSKGKNYRRLVRRVSEDRVLTAFKSCIREN